MTLAAMDFDYIAQLVHRRAAIVLEPGKEYLAESRLESVARENGLASVSELVAHMRSGRLDASDKVIDAMTTNETSWFRDAHPFNAMRDELLPDLIERRRVARALSIWCAASSSGQEPYSIAMLIRQHFPELDSWSVRILATDISPSMLRRTNEGLYSQLEVNRGLPAPMLVKHFTRSGMHWQVSDELRRMVQTEFVNLAELSTRGNIDDYREIQQDGLRKARPLLWTDNTQWSLAGLDWLQLPRRVAQYGSSISTPARSLRP